MDWYTCLAQSDALCLYGFTTHYQISLSFLLHTLTLWQQFKQIPVENAEKDPKPIVTIMYYERSNYLNSVFNRNNGGFDRYRFHNTDVNFLPIVKINHANTIGYAQLTLNQCVLLIEFSGQSSPGQF